MQVNKEASHTRGYGIAQIRDASRGSPRSLDTQKQRARDDNPLRHGRVMVHIARKVLGVLQAK